MNKIKTKASSVKNHVNRNRGKYGLAIGFTAAVAINRQAVKGWNEFLEEKGLTDEFYSPEI